MGIHDEHVSAQVFGANDGRGPDYQPDFNIDDVHREQIEVVAQEYGDIVWDAVFSCEAIGFYKTRPQAYLRAATWLQLDPSECLMVAAHPADLSAASRVGYKTAFVSRPTEWGRGDARPIGQSDGSFDYSVDSFEELADALNISS